MGRTRAELLDAMDGVEFLEWVAYADTGDPLLDLLAEQKADARTGVVASTVANCLTTGKKTYTPSDFTPRWNASDAPKQTTKDMVNAARRIAAAFANRK